jgi:hypothetical protein
VWAFLGTEKSARITYAPWRKLLRAKVMVVVFIGHQLGTTSDNNNNKGPIKAVNRRPLGEHRQTWRRVYAAAGHHRHVHQAQHSEGNGNVLLVAHVP